MNAVSHDDRVFTAIGLMSGTSMDGIDAAVLRTDGRDVVEVGAASTIPYTKKQRERLRRLIGDQGRDKAEAEAVGKMLTLAHLEAEALVEVAEAASAMFETTLDRNIARRRMERLQVALARLEEQR